ncbi:PIN domain-containing protein [Halorutilales archaeon Cl-col2-1]
MILDTTFLIDVLDGKEEAREAEEVLDKRGSAHVTPVSVMELLEGAYLSDTTDEEIEAVRTLLEGLNHYSFDTEDGIAAGKISADLIQKGERVGIEDTMIGAVALNENEKVLTRNVSDFERIEGVEVESY